jgi:hypothetical protein
VLLQITAGKERIRTDDLPHLRGGPRRADEARAFIHREFHRNGGSRAATRKVNAMRYQLFLFFAAAAMAAGAAQAGSQSSNTSSNSSSNNGVVRERVVDTYCEDGYCERYVVRRVYRDDRRRRRDHDRRYRDWQRDDD